MNGSAGRPGEVATAEDVAVQVRHGFAAVRAVVDDEPVAAFQIQFLRDLGGLEQQMAEQFVVVRRGLGDARDQLLRENQNVRRRLRGDVGRAMFFETLEEETFGKLFGKRKIN